jgi:hypothetical protein
MAVTRETRCPPAVNQGAPSNGRAGSGTNSELSAAQVEFLSALTTLGARLFTAAPGGKEFTGRPAAWQQLDPAGNSGRVARWQPGHALCGAMSSEVALVDVDPRNGGNVEQTRELLRGIGVEVFAEVRTPGDGAHFYVAGHPDLPIVSAAPGREGFTGRPGVEVISSGHHAYLPATRRPKYGGRGYEIVLDNLAALIDGGNVDGALAFVAWVDANRSQKPAEFVPAPPWSGGALDARERAYLNNALSGECATLAGMGPDSGRNNTLTQPGPRPPGGTRHPGRTERLPAGGWSRVTGPDQDAALWRVIRLAQAEVNGKPPPGNGSAGPLDQEEAGPNQQGDDHGGGDPPKDNLYPRIVGPLDFASVIAALNYEDDEHMQVANMSTMPPELVDEVIGGDHEDNKWHTRFTARVLRADRLVAKPRQAHRLGNELVVRGLSGRSRLQGEAPEGQGPRDRGNAAGTGAPEQARDHPATRGVDRSGLQGRSSRWLRRPRDRREGHPADQRDPRCTAGTRHRERTRAAADLVHRGRPDHRGVHHCRRQHTAGPVR